MVAAEPPGWGTRAMAKRKGDGQDDAAVGLFRDMLTELRELRIGQQETNRRLERLEAELGALRSDTAEGLDRLTSRLDTSNALKEQRVQDHEERLRRVEIKVFGT